MDNKKRIILLIVISVLIILTLSLGLTYAFMRPQVEASEEKSSITIKSCAKVQLKDSNNNSINLENTYPMADDKGLETKPYEFTVTSTCDNYVGFNLYLTSLTTNTIEDNAIHFAVTSKNGNLLVSDVLRKDFNASSEFNTDELKELDLGIKGTHKNIYKVYSNNVPLKGESEYKLYLWVDKDISEETTMNKSFTVGLSIKSYSREKTIADACLGETAECLAKNANLDSTLYYHDAELGGGAQDYSYRYAGTDEEVQNFVCLDGETTEGKCANGDADLYRVIGLFKNEHGLYEMKLIKYDYATSDQLGEDGAYSKAAYSYSASTYKGNQENFPSIGGYYWASSSNEVNEWAGSALRETNLNNYYLNTYLKEEKGLDTENLITTHTWSLNGYNANNITPKEIYDNEMDKIPDSSPDYPTQTKEVLDKIGLIYASDYGYAVRPSSTSNWNVKLSNYGSYTSNNWMYMGLLEWTISRFSADNIRALDVDYSGAVGYNYVSLHVFGIRPSFYLTSDVQIKSGDGTYNEPYRITI